MEVPISPMDDKGSPYSTASSGSTTTFVEEWTPSHSKTSSASKPAARPKLKTVRIAIVGTGLSSLTTAYLLSTCEAEKYGVHLVVDLFERGSSIGMDGQSLTVEVGETKRPQRIDTPWRTFNPGYYPNLTGLYRYLGINFYRNRLSFGWFHLDELPQMFPPMETHESLSTVRTSYWSPFATPRSISRTLKHWVVQFSGDVNSGPSLTLASLWNVYKWCGSIFRLLAIWFGYVLFLCVCSYHGRRGHYRPGATHPIQKKTVRQYVESAWYLPSSFVRLVLLPMLMTLCTCSSEQLLEHPIAPLLEYKWKTHRGTHMLVSDGVRQVVRRLIEKVDNVYCNAGITALEYVPVSDGVDNSLRVRLVLEDGRSIIYDHVILGVSPKSALNLMIAAETTAELLPHQVNSLKLALQRSNASRAIDAFSKAAHNRVVVMTHKDTTIFPECKRLPRVVVGSTDSQRTMVTHISAPGIYQTTMLLEENLPTLDSILSISRYVRFVLTMPWMRARSEFCTETGCCGPVQGPNIWYVGCWCHNGLPLMEGCVNSASACFLQLTKVLSIPAFIPWEPSHDFMPSAEEPFH